MSEGGRKSNAEREEQYNKFVESCKKHEFVQEVMAECKLETFQQFDHLYGRANREEKIEKKLKSSYTLDQLTKDSILQKYLSKNKLYTITEESDGKIVLIPVADIPQKQEN